MTYSVSNNCTKNCDNRTLTVQVIVEDVVTWIFLRHSVYSYAPGMLQPIFAESVVKHQATSGFNGP